MYTDWRQPKIIKIIRVAYLRVQKYLRANGLREEQIAMMVIAFITTNSGSVPLIEGLCAQIYYFRFEIIGGLRSHLLLFFFGRKNMFKKKVVSPRSDPAS